MLSLPLENGKDSFSLGHRPHISSHDIPMQKMDSYYSVTCIFSVTCIGHRPHISSHDILIQAIDSYYSVTCIFQSSIFANF